VSPVALLHPTKLVEGNGSPLPDFYRVHFTRKNRGKA
jgi:hypothetical protein